MATQTGSIDLTASNSVKLAAEAGWQSDLEDYATKAELDVQADRIGMVVANNDASSSLQLTADAMTYIGNNVTIKGTDGTSTVISGGQIQSGSLSIGAFDSAAQSATLNSNISVGGRNLLRNTGNPTASDLAFTRATVEDGIITITPTTSAGYAKFIVDYLDFDDYGEGEYTFSFDAKAVSGATYTNLKGPVAYAGFNVASRMSNASFSSSYDRYRSWTLSPTLTYDWTRYAQTFTVPDDLTTGQASALASGSNLTVVVAMTGSYAPMMVRNVKLEKGNKATDWTPAPEDVDAAISDAAKTATSYVTEITGQNGIMVHPSTDDDTGVQITSDVDILRNGYSVINVGTQGDTSGNTDAGVTIYDGTTNENVVATFDGDGIGLVGGAFRLTSERVTEEYGDENNPTTVTEIRSIMKSEGGNDNYETRCFLRSMVGEDDDAYYNSIELTSETDIETQSPTETNNASVEVGSDQWGSSVRLVADSQELHLHKHPVDGKDYFDLHSEVFLITDYHNGVNMWSTAPSTVLWSGAYYMTSNHTATLAYNISTCPTGVVLHFQPYGSTAQNYFHQYCFVPKTAVSDYSGSVHNFTLCNSGFAKVGMKALRIYDNRIVGDDTNDDTGTASGITFDNKYWVMTQVIAV